KVMRALFKVGRKDDGTSKKLEILDLKFEINSAKMLHLEEKMESLEKRLTSVEASNRKLAEAMMNLVEMLRRKELEGKTHREAVARRPVELTYTKKDEDAYAQTARMALEDQILEHLRNSGPSTPAQMQEVLNRSREHISRTLKALSERGVVDRRKRGKTFVYSLLTEPSKGDAGFEKSQPDV
ncbi:MAG: winged helix DNA-binding protein, partial [Candidatus Bathyarchaeia archaeon]